MTTDYTTFDSFIATTNGQVIGDGSNRAYYNDAFNAISGEGYNTGNLQNLIKRGDAVFFMNMGVEYVGFAKTDYQGLYINLYVQDYLGYQPVHEVTVSLLDFVSYTHFNKWEPIIPPPTPSRERKKFPWILYARKLRARQNNQM